MKFRVGVGVLMAMTACGSDGEQTDEVRAVSNIQIESNARCRGDDCPTSAGWTFCSRERSRCDFSGAKQVAYGARNNWVYQAHSGGVLCGNRVFGDPARGIGKACWIRDAPSGTSEGGDIPECANNRCPAGWVQCAVEKQGTSYCDFSGRTTVAFGEGNDWTYETHENGVACNTGGFSTDPARGRRKTCWRWTGNNSRPPNPTPNPNPGPDTTPGEETADLRASFSSVRTDPGFRRQWTWHHGINCGDVRQDGRNTSTETNVYVESKSRNAQVFYNDRRRQRFSCLPTVRMRTDASIQAACNQNSTVERAEIGSTDEYRNAGARIGNTVWIGWSQLWTERDDSFTYTDLQIRNQCGSGSPRTSMVYRPSQGFSIQTGKGSGGVGRDFGPGSSSRKMLIDRADLQNNVWYDFVMEVKLAQNNSGYIKVWVARTSGTNGRVNLNYDRPTATILNAPTAYADCPHLRWGLYRWDSGDRAPNQINSGDHILERVTSQARFKFGNNLGRAGFNAVVPRNVCN